MKYDEMPAHLQTIMQNTVECENDHAYAKCRPSFLHKPKLSLDGNKWCALYGTDLQNGVAGFGRSPEEAYKAFDVEWVRTHD